MKIFNFQFSIFNSKKGVSLYLALMIMFILIAIGLGVSLIIVSQMKMIRGMGDSVIAFYGADTGIEHALYNVRQENGDGNIPNGSVGNATYVVNKLDGEWKSIGTFTLRGIKRGIQIKGGEIIHTEQRWFRSETGIVNGLNARLLDPTHDASSGSLSGLISGAMGGDMGIKVWKCSSGCNNSTNWVSISGPNPVALISIGDTEGNNVEDSATWSSPQWSLTSGDSIIVQVGLKGGTNCVSWCNLGTFTTESLSASELSSALWTVYYTYTGSVTGPPFKISVLFRFDGSYNSYIENFTWK